MSEAPAWSAEAFLLARFVFYVTPASVSNVEIRGRSYPGHSAPSPRGRMVDTF